MSLKLITLIALLGCANALDLATFDGSANEHKFVELNDPVMGGQSTGTFTVNSDGKYGVLDGTVAIVPKLKAPGFVTAYADGSYPDASAMIGGNFVLTVRSSTANYTGFRFSFASGTVSPMYSCAGGGGIPFSRGCFKSKAFTVPAGDDFTTVKLPIDSFSDKWSSATGEQTSTCAQDKDVCVTAEKLKKIQHLSVWGEGVAGKIHLEIKSISIEGPSVVEAEAADGSVGLATFDGSSTDRKFTELNDPVMGGKSAGTFNVDSDGKFGVFDGEVVDVPALKAPGFITAYSDGSFPDASSMLGGNIVLTVRSSTPDYTGFRFSFASGTVSPQYACAGGGTIPFSRGCFKSKAFTVPAGSDFSVVKIPINSFSDKWSSATGEQTTTCAQDKDVCVTAAKLKKIQRVQVWAEGKAGKIHLEIKSIAIEGPSLAYGFKSIRPPTQYDTCKGQVQASLKFNVSGRTTPETLSGYVDPTESLAEAVCCDSRAADKAEPQFLYAAPDVLLFSKLDSKGVTTFYDSVCGVPLFKAPVNRTFDEFKADTDEHGWPSFRPAEVITENVVTDQKTGYVTSSCGTHLGSYLPDEVGPRWCMDLTCISGNKA